MSNRRRPSRGNTYRTGYLVSPQWFGRRDRWFRDEHRTAGGWTCAGCTRSADRRELELHHLSYAGVKRTPSGWSAAEAHEDLWSMHPACHELLHRIIDRDTLLARHRTKRQASLSALQIVRRKHNVFGGVDA